MEERRKLYGKYPSLKKREEFGDDYPDVCRKPLLLHSCSMKLTEVLVQWNDGREAVLLRWLCEHPQLPSMRNNPDAICAAIDEFAAQTDFLINIGPDKGQKVAALIAETKPVVVVELGGYVGYSAILFGKALRDAHKAAAPTEGGEQEAAPRPVLWSLEADPVFAGIVMNVVDLAGLGDVVKVATGRAADCLARLKQEGKLESIDMLFLDHVEELYHVDLQVAESLQLLKKGSHVVADNVLRPGAPEYRKYVRAHPKLETWAIEGLIIPGEFGVRFVLQEEDSSPAQVDC